MPVGFSAENGHLKNEDARFWRELEKFSRSEGRKNIARKPVQDQDSSRINFMPPFNVPSWKQLIKSYASDAKFSSSASESQLVAVEQALGVALPDALRELLFEADGVIADYGSGVIWSASDIQKRNQEFRTLAAFRELYMPFDHLLFFGDDGGGDEFAFAIHADGKIHKHDVFRWEHESDARSWYAGNLGRFLENRLNKQDDDDDIG